MLAPAMALARASPKSVIFTRPDSSTRRLRLLRSRWSTGGSLRWRKFMPRAVSSAMRRRRARVSLRSASLRSSKRLPLGTNSVTMHRWGMRTHTPMKSTMLGWRRAWSVPASTRKSSSCCVLASGLPSMRLTATGVPRHSALYTSAKEPLPTKRSSQISCMGIADVASSWAMETAPFSSADAAPRPRATRGGAAWRVLPWLAPCAGQ
mmetsp:Transcript_8122/g.23924  ORF Transcript_8122/g.23924 Transcript_8122/m.23924 type:complete len:207 (+) Transcript_8122:547-1167(+)